MARRGPLVFAVAILLAGALVFWLPFLTHKREVVSATPAVGAVVPLQMKPGSRLCLADLPMGPADQVARILTATGGGPGSGLTVTASGPGYRTRSRVHAGWHEGPLELPLTPPRRDLRGRFCVRNQGPNQIGVMAGAAGQQLARETPSLDGQPLQQDIPLTFHERQRSSLVARTGALVGHAAVFTPLPEPFLWILLVLVLAVVPAGALLALRAALAAGPVRLAAAGAPTPPLPARSATRRLGPWWRRGRALGGRIPARLVLALLVLAALVFIYVWAVRTTTFQPDEEQNVYFGRWLVNNFPQGLWNFTLLDRGLQRLEIWTLALGFNFFGSPTSFKFVHFLNDAAYASAAIPAYLLVRGAGARGRFALVAAALAVAVPWVVVATSFLTEPLSYPAFVWVLWATWRAVVAPSVGSELLAFAILAVALLTRSAFLLLVPLLPIAVVLEDLRFGIRRPLAIVRRHPAVAAAVALGLLGLLASAVGILPPLRRLAGSYGTPLAIDWGAFFSKVGQWSSRVVVGGGFIPFAVGLPWLVAELIRPRDERRHAFALVGLLAILLLLYASNPAGFDERYVMYFAAPLAVATAIALDRRDLRAPWVAAGGLLAAWLVWRQGWNPNGGPTEFFVAPAEAFYARVGLLRLQQHVPGWLTLRDAAFLLALVAAAVAAYAVSRRPRAAVVGGLLAVALVLLQITQMDYSLAKFVNGAGGRYQATLDQRAWIDKALRGKPGDVGELDSGVGNSGDYGYIWSLTEFWNDRLTSQWGDSAGILVPITPGNTPHIIDADPVTGRIRDQLPPYMVMPRDFIQVRPAGVAVERPSFNGLDLWRTLEPPHLLYSITNAAANGFVSQQTPATIRFYAFGLDPSKRWCGQVPIAAANALQDPSPAIPYRLGTVHGAIPSRGQSTVSVPLHFGGRPYVDVQVHLRGKVTTVQGVWAGRLLLLDVVPCGRG